MLRAAFWLLQSFYTETELTFLQSLLEEKNTMADMAFHGEVSKNISTYIGISPK